MLENATVTGDPDSDSEPDTPYDQDEDIYDPAPMPNTGQLQHNDSFNYDDVPPSSSDEESQEDMKKKTSPPPPTVVKPPPLPSTNKPYVPRDRKVKIHQPPKISMIFIYFLKPTLTRTDIVPNSNVHKPSFGNELEKALSRRRT